MKGFIKILEVVLATVIIIGAMGVFFVQPDFTRASTSDIEKRTENALAVLDRTGGLETYLSENRPDLLSTNLSKMLPESVGFSINVTDSSGTRKFLSGYDKNIVSSVFYITSLPEPYTIIVYLWEIF